MTLPHILEACAAVGVKGVVCFGMGLTLREGSRKHFYGALERHFPGLKERYVQNYGNSYELPSPNSGQLLSLFHSFCRSRGLLHRPEDCFAYLEELPEPYEQLSLFGS